ESEVGELIVFREICIATTQNIEQFGFGFRVVDYSQRLIGGGFGSVVVAGGDLFSRVVEEEFESSRNQIFVFRIVRERRKAKRRAIAVIAVSIDGKSEVCVYCFGYSTNLFEAVSTHEFDLHAIGRARRALREIARAKPCERIESLSVVAFDEIDLRFIEERRRTRHIIEFLLSFATPFKGLVVPARRTKRIDGVQM